MPDISERLLPLSYTAVRWKTELYNTCHVQVRSHECMPRDWWQCLSSEFLV